MVRLAWPTLVAVILLQSCQQKIITGTIDTSDTLHRVQSTALQAILDSAQLGGAILVFDVKQNQWTSNNFELCSKGFIPASTFKIPNTIIGLETGALKNDSHVFIWDGKPRKMERWNRSMNLHDAFHLSCVPCYQELARTIGKTRMEAWLKKLNFGNMVVDSVDLFWLEGKSNINCFEQIRFLKNLNEGKLPIKKQTTESMKKLMVMEETTHYILAGKTGWGMRDSTNVGWFIGYIKMQNGAEYYVATLALPKPDFNMEEFAAIRMQITKKALTQLHIIDKI